MGHPPPPSGCGIGLRRQHYPDFAQGTPDIDWVEAVTENFLATGGKPLAMLDHVRRDWPVGLHGVEMGIGDASPMSRLYLDELKALVERVEPAFISDHLCWGAHRGSGTHDLLPLPQTPGVVEHVARRVMDIQDFLGRQIALENISSYAQFAGNSLSEPEFVSAVAEAADCLLLVDVNNIAVNSFNHGLDAEAYIDALPAHRVQQIHIAGHTDCGSHLLDTHIGPVPDLVWRLYARAVARFGPVPTLLEWDQEIPSMPAMEREVQLARRIAATSQQARQARQPQQVARVSAHLAPGTSPSAAHPAGPAAAVGPKPEWRRRA